MIHYLRIWLASVRYSIVRSMMFRGDFIMWALVELFWMAVSIASIAVIYQHTDAVAGWTKYEMLLLLGTSMLIQRLLMGLFWSNLFEMGRNVRSGHFDFFLAQPGNMLFMVSTRKIDLDSLLNVFVALAVVVYAVGKLQLEPSLADMLTYALFVGCGVGISFAMLLLIASVSFWTIGSQGVEGGYFTLYEFSRLPRAAFSGVAKVAFVWVLPTVVVTNAPAHTLIHGLSGTYTAWLLAATTAWLAIAIGVFQRGLKRYSSASS
ncbi:ABC transporter permease [Synoicihabitans lomoniglobus]|uniref:ABC-2 family transporter protein n=1 Tax=Synoicihabitans lomoniglobus TaxID=2909285 RepID=A0AAF0I7Q9_9BACT|nr:ABC-2 family transporter protein [Opitutaceae bacterium LMO-M01]WED66931.1 ABC-2 family transporter protein [Opitutaceae bacterium LMO-M01]